MVCAVSFIVCAIVGSAVGSAFTVMSTIELPFSVLAVPWVKSCFSCGAIVSGSVLVIKCHLYQNQQT